MRRRPLLVLASLAVLLAATAVTGHAASVIKGRTWFPIGPAPISPGFGGVAAGRASVIAVNPANPDEVFLEAATGGVWHTVDAGLSWDPISDRTAALAIGAIALDPATCNAAGCGRIYVGTGENNLRRDTFYGRGLLVGVPEPGIFQGWAWVLKGESLFSLASINDVVLDPTTGGATRRIYVTVSSGVTASATESTITGPAPAMGFGIYKSEDDGDTWTKVDVPNTDGAKPTDLEMDPQDSNRLYAGFLGKGIFRGTRDPMTGTITWCPLNPGTGGAVCMGASGLPDAVGSPFDFVEVTIHRPGMAAGVLYASFGTCTDPICQGCNPPIHKSTDGGLTWTLQNAGAPLAYSRYTHVLTIHPSDPTKLLYGAVGMYLSHNSAANFDSDGIVGDDDIGAKPPPNQLHPDQQAIVFADPGAACTMQACNLGGNNCVIYAANDGGFYRSTDSGCSWRSRNDGLQITGFQSIGASPDTPTVIGGTQDNGTVLFSGSSTWSYETGGDTTGTRIDSDDEDRMYSITGGCSVVRSVFRSDDGGGSWGFEYESPMDEAAAFYPPMVEDPTAPHPLYLGTNRLRKSTTDASTFVPVSPALGGTVTFFPDIQRTNVVTAIAVAPDNPDRIYIGYYDGQIWVTDLACDNLSCWTQVGGSGNGLPDTTVTWIAVDPGNDDVAYVAYSGFFSGPHLYKTTTGGMGMTPWTAASGGGMTMLPSIPINTIAIEPSEPINVWVGTDSAPGSAPASVYKSTDGGMSWTAFADGLPNVPIFELRVVERQINPSKKFGRILAATHGRGAWALSQANITNFEGWIMGSIWDVPVYGDGYPKNASCFMQVLQSDGTVCAQGNIDARGGNMETDGMGKLSSSSPNYSGQDVVWACYVGTCVGGTPIASCNDDETGDGVPDLLTTVLVECDGVLGVDAVLGCPAINNPPSSILSLDTIQGPGFVTAAARGSSAGRSSGGGARDEHAAVPSVPEAPPDGTPPAWARGAGTPPGGASGSGDATPEAPAAQFEAMPAVQAGDGTSRILCEVPVPFDPTEAAQAVLERARDAILADPICQAGAVGARVTGVPPNPAETEEDIFGQAQLSVEAPDVIGGQLMVAMHAGPGNAQASCFHLGSLGVPTQKQIQVTRLKFETAAAGASGGRLRLTEQTPLGACELTVPTAPGDTPAAIIKAFNDGFQAPGIPGPNPDCPSERNARDAMMHGGDSLIFTLATGLTVCVEDPGVGFLSAPKEICFTDSDCDDMNACTDQVCDPDTHRCSFKPVPDGTRCQDDNLCTQGDVCVNGACGEPVRCDDQDPCTLDRCDPADGRCVFVPLVCDDGDACTQDFCDRESGGCRFQPIVGTTCDDGNPCTLGDRCSVDASGLPVCQGEPVRCDDGIACTVDLCDPLTGACLHSPVVCDDGNQCTRDFCDTSTGACRFDPLPGLSCDDGDLCTTDDVCRQIVGGPVVCIGTPIAMLEVDPVKFQSATLLEWSPTLDATHWNTYRGTIPATLLGSRPPGSEYDHLCYESDDAHGDGATIAMDAAIPLRGTALYYDVTGEGRCGEGPLGKSSSGVVRPNLSPCPTPP